MFVNTIVVYTFPPLKHVIFLDTSGFADRDIGSLTATLPNVGRPCHLKLNY